MTFLNILLLAVGGGFFALGKSTMDEGTSEGIGLGFFIVGIAVIVYVLHWGIHG